MSFCPYLDEDIYNCVISGNVSRIDGLIQSGVNPNHVFTSTRDSTLHGLSLLHVAVMEDRQNIIKYLISHKCDVNIAMRATHFDADTNVSTVEKVKPPGCLEYTCLYRTLIFGQIDSAKQLVNFGADVNLCDSSGSTALWHAVDSGNNDITKLILSVAKCNVNASDSVLMTPLHVAAFHGNSEIVKSIVRKSTIIDAPTLGGATPLKHACKSGSIQVVEMLLQHGADVNIRDSNQVSPLMSAIASEENTQIIIEILVNNGAIVCSVDVKNAFQSLGILGPAILLKLPELIPYLLKVCDKPLSLKLSVSLRIKQVLRDCTKGKSIKRHITRLPLPTALLHFLIFVNI